MKRNFPAAILVISLASPALAVAQPAAAPDKQKEEEKKRAQDLAELKQDRAKLEADHKAELARLTPEIHAEAKALTDKGYPSTHAAVKAALAGKHRKAGNADRDMYRHPIETLTFLGLQPTMTVVEFGPGEGWYTELLAPALAKKGKLLVTNGDP